MSTGWGGVGDNGEITIHLSTKTETDCAVRRNQKSNHDDEQHVTTVRLLDVFSKRELRGRRSAGEDGVLLKDTSAWCTSDDRKI